MEDDINEIKAKEEEKAKLTIDTNIDDNKLFKSLKSRSPLNKTPEPMSKTTSFLSPYKYLNNTPIMSRNQTINLLNLRSPNNMKSPYKVNSKKVPIYESSKKRIRSHNFYGQDPNTIVVMTNPNPNATFDFATSNYEKKLKELNDTKEDLENKRLKYLKQMKQKFASAS